MRYYHSLGVNAENLTTHTIICRPMQLRRLNDRVTETGSLNAPKVT